MPDPIRQEHINIGVVVIQEESGYIATRWLPDLERVRVFGGEGDLAMVRDFIAGIDAEIGDGTRTTAPKGWYPGMIQFTPERASTLEPASLLDKMYGLYVGDDHPMLAEVRRLRANQRPDPETCPHRDSVQIVFGMGDSRSLYRCYDCGGKFRR